MATERLVYGEPVEDLVPGLDAFSRSLELRPDGMYHGEATLESRVAAPLFRALMRAEAELLLADADAVRPGVLTRRTPAQRRADALVQLALALGEAVRRS